MIAIIDYEAGNLASVSNALNRLNAEHIVTNKANELDAADGIIFPGVGHAQPAMESLKKNNLTKWLNQCKKPILGICLGMQLMFESSEEGNGTNGLGIIPGRLKRFESSKQKVPHMGWNTYSERGDDPLLNGIDNEDHFYYVHSYRAPCNSYTIARCNYTKDFAAAVRKENFWGVQFHPEKSGEAGAKLLENFLAIVNTESYDKLKIAYSN